MTIKDFKQFDGKFGKMVFDHTSRLKQIHGRIKCIDDEKEQLTFKSTVGKVFHIRLKDIHSFEEKEALPEITLVKGRAVEWRGGVMIYTDTNEEYDPKR